jgi:hypothetical protein
MRQRKRASAPGLTGTVDDLAECGHKQSIVAASQLACKQSLAAARDVDFGLGTLTDHCWFGELRRCLRLKTERGAI